MEIMLTISSLAVFAYAVYELWYKPRQEAKGRGKAADASHPDKH